MSGGRGSWVVVVGLLFLAQLGVLAFLGPRRPGPALADLIEIALYLYSVRVFLSAARRSHALARSFWSVAAFSSVLFCIGTLCTLYAEVIAASRPPSIVDLADAISVFWFGPVSLTLFLEPDFDPRRFDRIHLLDFAQVVLLWVVVYLFFHYLPTHEGPGSPFSHSWLRGTWTGTLIYDAVMAGTFLLRAALSSSPIVRALFGRVGLFLVAAGAGDLYFNTLGAALPDGSWYEVVWTLLAVAPIVIAATWNEAAIEARSARAPTGDLVRNRLFPTLFGFLVLLLSLEILREETGIALVIVAVSFACSSARFVIVQERQDRVQVALRTQIAERERVERQLRENEEHLEEQVAERTARLEESRAQLRQAQKMEAIGRLAGGVAHDFNNLLTVIRGYGQLIVKRAPTPELRANAERIDEAAARAASLTSQLLAFSRRQVLQPTVFNVNTLVRNLDRMLRRLIGEDVEMTTVLAADEGSVRADPGQIEQVIMNLVVNARDAMPHGGKVTIETANAVLDDGYRLRHPTSRRGRHVVLGVSDTGVGIAPESLAQVFEPFYTTKGPGQGTGLGLSMVYGIVKQSGGDIWVYSEPGRGTSFKIYLPVVEAHDGPALEEPRRAAHTRGSETILLVEDDQHVRELARAVLVECGYSVLGAENGAQADSLCRTYGGEIHLLLTDVVMPGVGGRELARQVIALRPRVRVLYMSGYTSNAIVHHGELDANTSFLPKPFTPASLAAKIRQVLDESDPARPGSP
ncbi:MAG TPA: ATP-binding protein [Vicinamibacteria bacterium]|nr:ATP-binding protein [Vicinamibacteria bacterium]